MCDSVIKRGQRSLRKNHPVDEVVRLWKRPLFANQHGQRKSSGSSRIMEISRIPLMRRS